MLTYSIAIRTLGTGGEKFREELLSIARQTIQPERLIVYIAEGYSRPGFTIGNEEYVWVKKGMMAQRILPYDEISSDCIMMLDDDVRLSPDSAERMLKAMEKYDADCVGADTFRNQNMTIRNKVYAALTNLVFPHYSSRWAFIIHRNGSFSYNNRPVKSFYWSQSCAGPASLWRKNTYEQLRMEDELWLDELGFTYGDDMLEFYKLHANGFRLGILYDSGIENLDGCSSSHAFRKSRERMYIRTKASFIIWWRTCFRSGNTPDSVRWSAAICFALKTFWLFFVVCGAAVATRKFHMVPSYVSGWRDGWSFVHSATYKAIGNFAFRHTLLRNEL